MLILDLLVLNNGGVAQLVRRTAHIRDVGVQIPLRYQLFLINL